MKENIKEISTIIANKLVLREKAVILWVETNKYEFFQLNTLVSQIHFSKIFIPGLVTCIITNNVYRI